MLPRGQAWQDCISLCVSIRLRELRGISALARLGYLLDRACTGSVVPCDGERIIKGDSILHLDLLLPHFSYLPKWHQLFYPIRRSQDNFSIAYNKQASPRHVCFCSWQNNTGIRPYYRVHLMACHRSPVIWSSLPAQPAEMQNVQVYAAEIQDQNLVVWVFPVCLAGFSGGVFICSNH